MREEANDILRLLHEPSSERALWALIHNLDFEHPRDHFQVPEEAQGQYLRSQASGFFSEQVINMWHGF